MGIVYGNPNSIRLAARAIGKNAPRFLATHDWNRWFVFAHDRFGRVKTELNVQTLDPYEPKQSSKTFEDCCDERAKELIGRGLPLQVFWSGGIDSTVALVALWRAGIDSDQLTVVTRKPLLGRITKHGHGLGPDGEYPGFHERFIAGKYRRIDLEDERDSLAPNTISITGELGDQIWGGIDLRNFVGRKKLNEHWRKHMTCGDHMVWRRLTHAAPYPIHTVKEFIWWKNFSMKWQDVSLRILSPGRFHMRPWLAHFYDTPDFQDWAVSTPMETKISGNDWYSYKQAAKDYVAAFTRDEDWRRRATKMPSLPCGTYNNGICAVFDDGQVFRYGRMSLEASGMTEAERAMAEKMFKT